MNVSFEVCFTRIINAEGEYVDNPLDKGGPTKYGITLQALMGFRKKIQTAEDMKALSITDAKLFYEMTYWNPMHLDDVKALGISILLLDQAINRGIVPTVKDAQRALKACKAYLGEADGLIGPITISALNKVDYKSFGLAYFKFSQESYVKICQNNPEQNVFLLGWIRRTHALLDQILI